ALGARDMGPAAGADERVASARAGDPPPARSARRAPAGTADGRAHGRRRGRCDPDREAVPAREHCLTVLSETTRRRSTGEGRPVAPCVAPGPLGDLAAQAKGPVSRAFLVGPPGFEPGTNGL